MIYLMYAYLIGAFVSLLFCLWYDRYEEIRSKIRLVELVLATVFWFVIMPMMILSWYTRKGIK